MIFLDLIMVLLKEVTILLMACLKQNVLKVVSSLVDGVQIVPNVLLALIALKLA